MSFKIGRNDPCPCGSKKKYKKCHPDVPPEVLYKELVLKKMVKGEEEERRWKAKYGDVRQPIWIDHQGHRVVASGKKLHIQKLKQPGHRFFADFLIKYLDATLGKEWGQAELSKPFDQRHVLVQWRTKCLEYMQKQTRNPDGTFCAIPSGFTAAYLNLAYDLHVVEDNGPLDDDLMSRLKHPDQFQGARHELFVEATCLRAGFTIEHENEKDRSKRHTEFTAIHKKTGQRISVEAKSKHHPGILGRPGKPKEEDEFDLRFGQLLNDAIAKNPPYPLAVFIDTNVPPATASHIFTSRTKEPPRRVIDLLKRIRKQHGGIDPFSLVVFTNHPHHYVDEDEIDPAKNTLSILSQKPKIPVTYPEALISLHEAANIYGHIPNEFPEREK